MDRKDRALWFAALGFAVFPLKPNSKDPFTIKAGDDPAMCGGVNLATTDPLSINWWFRRHPDMNYGISAAGRVVLDIDPRKDPPNWIDDYAGLGPLPRTLTVNTPSGGIHIWFAGVESGQKPLSGATTIDVRSRGGYVVGPQSMFKGKEWTIADNTMPAPCPPAIAARLSKPGDKEADNSTPLCELDTPATLTWAESAVALAPGALQDNRNNALFKLATALKDKGVSCETNLELLRDRWCLTCDPPYTDTDEIEKTVVSAYNNGQRRPGCDSPDVQFENLATDPDLLEWDRRRAAAGKTSAAPQISPVGLLERVRDIPLAEIIARQSSALVKRILHRGEQAVLYADPGAGKSFVVLDLAWHLALGKPEWHGFRIKRAPVLYIALEGVEGFRKRMHAVSATFGDPDLWFARLKAHVSLIRDPGTGGQGLATVLTGARKLATDCAQPVGLVIIDTLARAMAGDDENATADIMHFVDHRAGVIAKETGAAVMTVAHTNKLGTLRGSLTLSGAVDVVLKIERTEDQRTLIGEKVKDDDGAPLFDFALEKVRLGIDDDGEAVTSCVIRSSAPAPRVKEETAGQKRVRAAFDAAAAGGAGPVPLAEVKDEFCRRYPTGEVSPDKARNAKRVAWDRDIRQLPPDLVIEDRDGERVMLRKGRRGKGTDADTEFEKIDP